MSEKWRLFRIPKPKENKGARRAAKLQFQTMWVAGTVGAYFAGIAKSLFADGALIAWAAPVDWTQTAQRSLLYGYKLWLLAYFVIAHLRNQRVGDEGGKEPTPKDLGFDVLQSVVSLAALFALNSLVSDKELDRSRFYWAVIVGNTAVAIICAASRWLFSDNGKNDGVNTLRTVGAYAAVISVVFGVIFAVTGSDGDAMERPLTALFALLALLGYVLWIYARLTVDLVVSPTTPSVRCCCLAFSFRNDPVKEKA